MHNPRLAGRYAKSLLDIANEQNQLEPVLADMQLLQKLCVQNRDFELLLRSPVVKPHKKQQILDLILGGKISALSQAFMKLLVSKGREGNLPEIASGFIAAYKAQKKIKTLRITSAAPMSDMVKQGILGKVADFLPGFTLEMEEAVNPELIGGYILEMDSKMVDASIRRDLNDVRKQFADNLYVHNIR